MIKHRDLIDKGIKSKYDLKKLFSEHFDMVKSAVADMNTDPSNWYVSLYIKYLSNIVDI